MVIIKSTFSCFLLFMMIIHAPFAWCSSSPLEEEAHFKHEDENTLSPKMTFEVTVHGILLWVSLGFLMPIGTLIIRMSNREGSGTKRLRFYFYFHLIIQMVSVVVATAGAIMSMKTFENSFNNNHQRIGLALYAAIWVQAVLGFLRPHRGNSKRSIWYFLHWIFGSIVGVGGIINIYTGLEAYKKKTNKSITLWTILFTVQIFFLAFLYLFQDKWDYIQKQRINFREVGQVRPSDQESSQRENHEMDTWRGQPCAKANSLKSLFN